MICQSNSKSNSNSNSKLLASPPKEVGDSTYPHTSQQALQPIHLPLPERNIIPNSRNSPSPSLSFQLQTPPNNQPHVKRNEQRAREQNTGGAAHDLLIADEGDGIFIEASESVAERERKEEVVEYCERLSFLWGFKFRSCGRRRAGYDGDVSQR